MDNGFLILILSYVALGYSLTASLCLRLLNKTENLDADLMLQYHHKYYMGNWR